MARMPGAVWRPIAHSGADLSAHDILCYHTMVGSLNGTDSYFRGNAPNGSSSHFGVGHDGVIYQWVDTANRAAANLNGNHHIISVETADVGTGFPKWNLNDGSAVPSWTAAQIEANAKIAAWVYKTHGIPLSLIPDSKPGRKGIGYHRQGCDPNRVSGGEKWSTAYGKVCPGNRRISQIPSVIARAKHLISPVPEDDMAAVPQGEWDNVQERLIRVEQKVDRLVEVLLDRVYPRTGVLPDDKIQEARLRDLIRYTDGNALVTRRQVAADAAAPE